MNLQHIIPNVPTGLLIAGTIVRLTGQYLKHKREIATLKVCEIALSKNHGASFISGGAFNRFSVYPKNGNGRSSSEESHQMKVGTSDAKISVMKQREKDEDAPAA